MRSQALPPAVAPVTTSEEQADKEGIAGSFTCLQQRDDFLGQNERDVVLQSFLESMAMLLNRIGRRGHVQPHLAVPDIDREAADIVGKGIEGAPGSQVETGVVPVAGQNSSRHRASLQGESHMGAAVIDRVDPALVLEEDHHPVLNVYDQSVAALHVREAGYTNLAPTAHAGMIGADDDSET